MKGCAVEVWDIFWYIILIAGLVGLCISIKKMMDICDSYKAENDKLKEENRQLFSEIVQAKSKIYELENINNLLLTENAYFRQKKKDLRDLELECKVSFHSMACEMEAQKKIYGE